jgi:hypothetical protein
VRAGRNLPSLLIVSHFPKNTMAKNINCTVTALAVINIAIAVKKGFDWFLLLYLVMALIVVIWNLLDERKKRNAR